jgi:hypothetical protein
MDEGGKISQGSSPSDYGKISHPSRQYLPQKQGKSQVIRKNPRYVPNESFEEKDDMHIEGKKAIENILQEEMLKKCINILMILVIHLMSLYHNDGIFR